MYWTKEQLDTAWGKARVAPNRDKEKYRLDAAGAMIYRDKRENTDMAWEVDHIFPREILEYFRVPEEIINKNDNLRAMHHSNNSSKGISFPRYSSTMKWDENKEKNVDRTGWNKVGDRVMSKLRKLFEPYLGMILEEAVHVYEDENES